MIGQNAQGEWVDYAHKCSGCNTHLPLPEWAGKFCPQCGQKQHSALDLQNTPVPVESKCVKCSALLPPNAKFCPECGTKQPASNTGDVINITDYLPYKDEEDFQIKAELVAPRDMLKELQILKGRGMYLAYDWSKSQGLDIRTRSGNLVGHVTVFSNDAWLKELHKALIFIALAVSN